MQQDTFGMAIGLKTVKTAIDTKTTVIVACSRVFDSRDDA